MSLLRQSVLGGREAALRNDVLKLKEKAAKEKSRIGASAYSPPLAGLGDRSYGDGPSTRADARTGHRDQSLRKLDASRMSQLPTMIIGDRGGVSMDRRDPRVELTERRARNIIDKLDRTQRDIDDLRYKEISRKPDVGLFDLKRATGLPLPSESPLQRKSAKMAMETL